MPRTQQFSSEEIHKIFLLKSQKKSVKDIAKVMNRSCAGIYKVLTRKNHAPKPRSGRPKKTSLRDDRQIVRIASNNSISLRQIAAQSQLNVSKDIIHRRLRQTSFIVHQKMQKQPPLTHKHKQERLTWAKEHMTWDDQWISVIFSDEKKWNLDGPDGWASYWHDLRKEKKCFFSRQQGGGSVMVWGAFSFNGVANLAIISGRQKSEDYQRTLEEHLLPYAEDLGGAKFIFQQDNASIHSSNSTKAWFLKKNITVMKWPARSPDLNPIENLWGIMSRRVYTHNKQFESVNELKKAILNCWFTLEPELLQNLIQSMKHRVFDVINNNGNCIRR